MANELPYQTYERTTGQKWTGGSSAQVQEMYKKYGITQPAGSAQANLALQKALLGNTAPKTDTTSKTIGNQQNVFQSTEQTTQKNNKNKAELDEITTNYTTNNGQSTTETTPQQDVYNGKKLSQTTPSGFSYNLPPLEGDKQTYLFDDTGRVYTKDKSGKIELDIKGEEQYNKNLEFNKQIVERNKMYDNAKVGMDAVHQALIDRIKAQATEQREKMTDLNKRYSGLKEKQAYRTGGMEYTPEIATGVLEDEEEKGLKRLKKIDDDMIIALAEARSAKTAQDFQAIESRLKAIKELQTEKEKTVLQMYKTYMDNAKYVDDKVKEADTLERLNRDQSIQELKVAMPALVDTYNALKDNTKKQAYIQSLAKKMGLDEDVVLGTIKGGALDIADKKSIMANRNNNETKSENTNTNIKDDSPVALWFEKVNTNKANISAVPKEYKTQVLKMTSNANKMFDPTLLKYDLADQRIPIMINEGFAKGYSIDEMLATLKLPEDIKKDIKKAIITKSKDEV